ncbi:MAG: sulfatase-like hydrolase/transferase [Bacteroidota bacterium]
MTKLPQYHSFKPFLQTIYLLAVSLFGWLFTRLCLYFFNLSLFDHFSKGEFWGIFFGGLRFDLSAMVMFNLLFIILNVFPLTFREHRAFRMIRLLSFVIPNSLAFMLNLADTAYFPFSGKRMTGDIFNYMKAGGNDLLHLIPQYLIDFWYAVLLLILLSVLLTFLFIAFNKRLEGRVIMGYALKQLLSFFALSVLSVIAIRGGMQLKPITLISAGQYASPANLPLVLNTPFSIIKTMGNREVKEVNFFADSASLIAAYNPVKLPKPIGSFDSTPGNRLNVVVIILESFSTEHIGALCYQSPNQQKKKFTPFLDSLIGQSLSYKGFANGKRSIEGIPAVLASLPTLMNNDFITSSFSGNSFCSLANLLKTKGYTSSFYHGGSNGTMNFNDFTKMAGFENYYGRNEYNNDNDYDGQWGIYDEPFLQYFALKLSKTQQPFVSAVFTLSSHHPYTIPEKYKGKFPQGKLPIEESISYTDYALKRFFQTASKQAYFKNTLFVITADHTSEAFDEYYKTRLGMYSVPIIFYRPGFTLNGRSGSPVQQADIMPSVLQFLGYDKPYLAFGRSVFDPSEKGFALSYLNNSYFFLYGDYALVFDGVQSKELYNIKTDPMQHYNIIGQKPAGFHAIEQFLKAVIQQYNQRMIENRLVPGK